MPVHLRAPPTSVDAVHEFQVHQLNSYLDPLLKVLWEEVLQAEVVACTPSIKQVGLFRLLFEA